MNSQRKCGAQGAAVLLQEFLWLGECAARSSCHAYHPGYKMIIEKDIHMIWHSQNGIHMFFFFRVTCCSLSKIFQQQGSAQEGDWVHRWRGDLRWGPQDHYGLGLWPASRQWRHEPKKRLHHLIGAVMCGYALCWFQRTCGGELYWFLIKPFFASHMFIADCNYSMLFHAGDFVNFGQKCVLADLDVATWNWFCAGGLHWVVRLLWQPFPSPPKWEAGEH
jgi:hypothetical protein